MRARSTLALLLGAAAIGCGDGGGGREAVEVPLSELPCQSLRDEGIWESVPFPVSPCEWFDYQAQTTYRFEHPLGRAPSIVLGYISFSADGTGSTPASGDPFLIQDATDTTVTITSAQNQDFFLRLVLE